MCSRWRRKLKSLPLTTSSKTMHETIFFLNFPLKHAERMPVKISIPQDKAIISFSLISRQRVGEGCTAQTFPVEYKSHSWMHFTNSVIYFESDIK